MRLTIHAAVEFSTGNLLSVGSFIPPSISTLCAPKDGTMTSTFSEQKTTLARHERVTVVVPCMNEEESAEQFCVALNELESTLSDHKLEFIIVDDGSTDQSVDHLRCLLEDRDNFQIIEHGVNRGVAAAIQTGIEAAKTDIVCSMDFDCTYDPSQFENLLPALTDEVDIVIGSPYHPAGTVLNVPKWRLVISKFASLMYRFAMRTPLHTYTSCFRVYRRSSVAGIQLANPGFVGVAEMLWRLERRGGNVAEVPAVLDVRQFGQSKMRVVQVTLAHLDLLRMILSSRPLPITEHIVRPDSSELAAAERAGCN